MTNFVKIQKAAFECLVLPHNIDKVESALAKLEKPTKRDPFKRTRYDNAREFPVYTPGMSTGEYVSHYNSLNNRLNLTDTIDANQYAQPAAQYDPNVPLCVEDANPDYIPGLDDAPVKGKRARKVKVNTIELLSVLKWVTACLENPHGAMDRLAAIEKARNLITKADES